MISKFSFYHGAALCRLIHAEVAHSVKLYPSKSNSSYMVDDSIGIFIKHSSKRLSPWSFTFTKEQKNELLEMCQLLNNCFLVFICHEDGIACVSFEESQSLIDYSNDRDQWICARRRRREEYSLDGSKGQLNHKIADNEYPEKIIDSKKVMSI